ncbi:MAG: glycosyltransferase family A protein [Candidatus Zixiibacteriota bacterium]
MSDLTVTTVIPTFNRAHLLGRALSSVVRNSRPGDEIIVVDNGSTDHTDVVIAQFGDAVRSYVIRPRGAGFARNLGVREAHGDLVAFLDSDDEWFDGKLDKQRSFMQQRTDVLFCFTNFAGRDKEGNIHHNALQGWHNDQRSWKEILGGERLYSLICPIASESDDFYCYHGDLYLSELRANYVFTSTMVVRREDAADSLHFAEDTPTYEDWECFGRLSRKGNAAYLDVETAWQHAHTGPRLTDADAVRAAQARLTIIERVWGNDPRFMAKHSEEYDKLLNEQKMIVAGGLIVDGRTREARSMLDGIADLPLSYRIGSRIPGPVAKALHRIKRLVSGS